MATDLPFVEEYEAGFSPSSWMSPPPPRLASEAVLFVDPEPPWMLLGSLGCRLDFDFMHQNCALDYLLGLPLGPIQSPTYNNGPMEEESMLGTGSFGSVYNGTLSDGTNIAVKVFNLQVEGALGSFDTECEVLRNVRHRNLIKIISSCSNEDFKALMLEFMPNGTLERWLHSDGHCLDIIQRLNIMIDVASALEYLHNGYSVPIIHCDLKPSNVLLDEDLVAHVGDFGLTKLLGEGTSVTHTMRIATIGYIAPEYRSLGIVTTKGDTYSFGILLMETFTKRKPTSELFDGEMSLKLWVKDSLSHSVAEVMDANLREEEQHMNAITNCVSSILELALDCCAETPNVRKNMNDVVAILSKIKQKYLKDTRKIR